ncbi:MAG: nitrate reductase cytochrome c-type subunit [Betaproteobacteria bacterium]|nr:nitrate reductase cytochrome c-type subunit [Candidatus Dechloromonas phosphorivorans]
MRRKNIVNQIGNVTIEEIQGRYVPPEKDQQTITRNFQKQPPLIRIASRVASLPQNFNKCMDCHSRSRPKKPARPKGP